MHSHTSRAAPIPSPTVDYEYDWLHGKIVKRDYEEVKAICSAELQSGTLSAERREIFIVIRGEVALAEGEVQLAIALFDQALGARPDNLEALVGRGIAYIELQEFALAEELFHKALKIFSECTDAWAGLGECALRCNKLSLAWDFYCNALNRKADHAMAIKGLVRVGVQLQRYEEVIQYIQQLLYRHPAQPHLQVSLACCYIYLGKKLEAYEEIEKALVIAPDFQEAQQLKQKIIAHEERSKAELGSVK